MAVEFRKFVLIVFVTYAVITIYFISGLPPGIQDVSKQDYIVRGKVRQSVLPEDQPEDKHAEQKPEAAVQKVPGEPRSNRIARVKQNRQVNRNIAKNDIVAVSNNGNKKETKRRSDSRIIKTIRPYAKQNKSHVPPNKPVFSDNSISIHIPMASNKVDGSYNKTNEKQNMIIDDKSNVNIALSDNIHLPVQTRTPLNNSHESRYVSNVSNRLENSAYLPLQDTLNFTSIASNIYVYSAFYDNRDGRYIRMIAIATSAQKGKPTIWCHFHNNSSTRGEFYKTCEDHNRPYAGYVISCAVPNLVATTQLVQKGITMSSIQASNQQYDIKIKIFSTFLHKNESKQFNVCVPPLFGEINPQRLVEFIEMSKLLGAEHFTFYSFSVKPDAQNVLDMYSRRNEASVLPWKLPVTSNNIWYYGQSVSVWDCLYRNMNYFKYITFNDIDEFIVPKSHTSWDTMIRGLNNINSNSSTHNHVAAYRFQSEFFHNPDGHEVPALSEAVQRLVTLNTIWRTKTISGLRTKLIVDPLKVLEIGIHHLSKPLKEDYVTINVPPSTAVVQHYRKCVRLYGTICDEPVKDYTMWQFYSTISRNVQLANDYLKL